MATVKPPLAILLALALGLSACSSDADAGDADTSVDPTTAEQSEDVDGDEETGDTPAEDDTSAGGTVAVSDPSALPACEILPRDAVAAIADIDVDGEFIDVAGTGTNCNYNGEAGRVRLGLSEAYGDVEGEIAANEAAGAEVNRDVEVDGADVAFTIDDTLRFDIGNVAVSIMIEDLDPTIAFGLAPFVVENLQNA